MRYRCGIRRPPVASHPSRRPTIRPNTTSRNQTGRKNSVRIPAFLGLGLQHPFDHADGRQQADRAPGQARDQDDRLPRGHRPNPAIASRKLMGCELERPKINSGGRTRDRTLDLSRVKG
jgi:hypothetical protein